ncbi:uncharacterized protein [Mobula birostris]|uniref:uncharacterized protein n=1 Tax=Mobula birostris TaxID=1983395 RepID=UPI003B27BC16
MEANVFGGDLFGVGKQRGHSRSTSSNPTSCNSPRFLMNKTMDTDSGILSSCSNMSSSETYNVGKEILSAVDLEDVCTIGRYDRQSERKVALTLLKSESRRCTLTECLQSAWCTLKEQRERMCKKNMEVVNHSAVIDSMILKQKLLETKVGLLLKEEGTSHGVGLDESRRERELQNRIWCLEEEIEHFNQKLGQLTSKRRDPKPTVSCYLREENSEPEGQPQNYLQTLSDSLECRQEHWNFKEMSEDGDPASKTHATSDTPASGSKPFSPRTFITVRMTHSMDPVGYQGLSSAVTSHSKDTSRQNLEVHDLQVAIGQFLQGGGRSRLKEPVVLLQSQWLSLADVNCNIGNRELLAVKLALEEWHHWLKGAKNPFVIWADRKNLAYIQEAKRLNSRLEENLRELASCLVGAENGKASLENQVSDLHTQLFQTKCESYGLKKQCLESELQLTANRNAASANVHYTIDSCFIP